MKGIIPKKRVNLASLSFHALETSSNLSSLFLETSLVSHSSHALVMNLVNRWITMVTTQPCTTWTVCGWDLRGTHLVSQTPTPPFCPLCLAPWVTLMTVWTAIASHMLWAQCWRPCWRNGAWEMNCFPRREENGRQAGNSKTISYNINILINFAHYSFIQFWWTKKENIKMSCANDCQFNDIYLISQCSMAYFEMLIQECPIKLISS